MAETKFTPGPWTAQENAYGTFFIKGPAEYISSTGVRYNELIAGGNNHSTLTKFNAQLISASPELYDGLVIARDYVEADLQQRREAYRGYENLGHINQVERELNAIDAALAKARGEAV